MQNNLNDKQNGVGKNEHTDRRRSLATPIRIYAHNSVREYFFLPYFHFKETEVSLFSRPGDTSVGG